MQENDLGGPDEKFISAVVCRNIHRLLADKYPSHDFFVLKGMYFTENEHSHSHAIIGPGFQISVRDVSLTLSKSNCVANMSNELFDLFVGMDHDSVGFDLADPDSIDNLLARVDKFITTGEI